MAIQVQNIINEVKNIGLDADGSDYYDFDRDIKDSVNIAVKWLIAVINRAYGENKLGEEIFQEITYGRIFQTDKYSRIFFDSSALGHDVWTILGVYPKPITIPSSATINSVGDAVSQYRDDVSIDKVASGGAKREVIEEKGAKKVNPFSAGYDHGCDDLKSYTYMNKVIYKSTGYSPSVVGQVEIEPTINKQFVGVYYVAVPDEVTDESDTVPFPATLESLLFNKTQNLISRKQGDNTTIFSVTERDINFLLQAIS